MAQSHVVLVGSVNPTAGATTFGTGFLVGAKRKCWLVTCRHVIHEAAGGPLFALPQPKHTKNPPGGYNVLALGSPRFHTADSQAGSYDIAVAKVQGCDLAALLARGITPVDLAAENAALPFPERMHVKAIGYPVDYAIAALAGNSDQPLHPKQVEGEIRTIPLHLSAQFGFAVPLREAFFAQTASTERGGKGMSGAVVCAVDDDITVGMVLADGDFQYSANGTVTETFGGFVFASFQRILETLSG